MAYRDEDFVDMDMPHDSSDNEHSFIDTMGRRGTEDAHGRFLSGSREAYNSGHGSNADDNETAEDNAMHNVDASLDTRGKTNEQLKMQRKLNKDKYKHEEKVNAKNWKERIIALKKDPRVKMLSKIALGIEALKLMIDHHQDELTKIKANEKLKERKESAATSKKAANVMAKKAQQSGLFVEPVDVQTIARHVKSGNSQQLLQQIDKGWNTLKGMIGQGVDGVQQLRGNA